MEKTKFRVEYDGKTIPLSKRMVDAIKELMLSEIELMRDSDENYSDCWTWGLASFKDVGNSDWLVMTFGGEDDKPNCGINEILVKL